MANPNTKRPKRIPENILSIIDLTNIFELKIIFLQFNMHL